MRGIRRSSVTVATSVGLVVAVAVGVFASASFATDSLAGQTSDVHPDDVTPMAELRTRGSVKAVDRGGDAAYKLDFTAIVTPPADDAPNVDEQDVPALAMEQSISLPTVSVDREYVGPVKLPFTTEKLTLRVEMNPDPDTECFRKSGRDNLRMKGFRSECTKAWLSLGDERVEVTDLFVDVDSRLSRVGKDGSRLVWRAKATFLDPGYAFPIASLGNGGDIQVWIGNLYGQATTDRVSFSAGS